MKKVLLSVLCVSTLLIALCMIGCATEPKGTEGKITLSDTTGSITGSNGLLTVTLKDADLTQDTISLKVTSGSYATGIYLTLNGKNGVYSGNLYFSTTAYNDSTIRVNDGDQVTITYSDAKPGADRSVKLTWNGAKGTVALDAAAYSSIAAPMTITVNDLDMAAPSLDVDITTTFYTQKTTITLNAVAGSYGKYSGNVYFTAGPIPGNDTIRVKDGDQVKVTYNDAVPPGTTVSATATWNGVAGTVTVAPTAVTGLKSPMTITVADVDVADPTITVKVASQKDATGISVVLNAEAGSAGTYSGQVAFSLKASVPGSVIAVQNADQITVSYADIAPAATRTATATWAGASATLTVDSTSYHKTIAKMTITLTDNDIVDTSVVVMVKSTKDTIGIPVTLTGSNFTFSGKVGFSMSASSASAIAANDSGTVTVSYSDSTPVETKTTTATWYSELKPAIGIFGQNATPGSGVVPGLNPTFINWTTTCTIDSLDSAAHSGTGQAMMITAVGGTWAGCGWAQGGGVGINMTAYMACSLHVWLKGNATDLGLLVENVNPGPNPAMQTWVSALANGYLADEAWHELVIPISAWTGTCDLTNVSNLLGIRFNNPAYTAGQYVEVDDLYWTLP
jgi:hypothetical protein